MGVGAPLPGATRSIRGGASDSDREPLHPHTHHRRPSMEADGSSQPEPAAHGNGDDSVLPSGARSAAPGSPLRLYTAYFLLGGGGGPEGGQGAAAAAACLHQYLYEHPNGLFIVGLAELHSAIQAARSEGVAVTRIDFLPSFSAAAASGGGSGGGGPGAGAAAAMEEALDEEEEEEEGAAEGAAGAAGATGNGDARVAALVAGNRVAAGARRGRKKGKGDLIVKPGTVLATVALADGRAFDVPCGVAGQVLELNERVAADPSLLVRKPTTEGYLAIIQPPRFPAANQPPPDRSSLVPFDKYRRRFGDAAVASLL